MNIENPLNQLFPAVENSSHAPEPQNKEEEKPKEIDQSEKDLSIKDTLDSALMNEEQKNEENNEKHQEAQHSIENNESNEEKHENISPENNQQPNEPHEETNEAQAPEKAEENHEEPHNQNNESEASPETQNQGEQTDNFEEPPKPQDTPSRGQKGKKSARNDIPPNLKPYVKESPDTPIYQALSGMIPIGLTQEEIQQLLSDLGRYVDVCIDNDLIGEAVFVQGIANDIRNDKSIERETIQENYDNIDSRLKEQKRILEEENAKYEKQIIDIQNETNEKLNKLDQKFNQAVQELDKEWSTPERAQLYTKPSAELLNLRHMLTKMVKSRQLANVDTIAAQIEQREKEELAAHQKRMQADYDVADRHLQNVFQSEKASIISNSEKRVNDVLCEKERNSRRFISKIETLEREKQTYLAKYRNSGLDTKEDRGKTNTNKEHPTARPAVRSFNEQKLPDFVTTAKLPPPTFVPKKRTMIQSVQQQPVIKKPRNGRGSSRARLYDGL